MRLQVFRVQVSEVTETAAIAARARRDADPEAFDGDKTVTARASTASRSPPTASPSPTASRPPARRSAPASTREPVTEQVAVGTKPRPAAAGRGRRPELGRAGAVRVRRQLGRSTPATATTAGYQFYAAHVAGRRRQRACRTRPRREQQTRSRADALPAAGAGRGRTAASQPRPVAPLSTAPEQPDGLLGPAAIRELAQQLDLRPTKTLGQNFLHDANTIRRIVRTAGPAARRRRPRGRARASAR